MILFCQAHTYFRAFSFGYTLAFESAATSASLTITLLVSWRTLLLAILFIATMLFLLETVFLIAEFNANFDRAIWTTWQSNPNQQRWVADDAVLVATSGSPFWSQTSGDIAVLGLQRTAKISGESAVLVLQRSAIPWPRIPAAKAPYLFSDGIVLNLNIHAKLI